MIWVSKSFFEHFKKKRNSLLKGGKRSEKTYKLLESIETAKNGGFVKIKVHDEKDAHNIRSWLSKNKKNIRLEARNLYTNYKKEEGVLYIHIR